MSSVRSCWPNRSSATSCTTPSPQPAELSGWELLRRWSVFLHDGFDTFGECWGWGTPVHAWSATPTKDLVWYVLGVTPAEPGYGTVRVAPRPGAIERVTGAVPTPHGLVRVNVEDNQVRVESPVPVRFVSLNGDESAASAGHSEFTL
jgi:alpha-L-rhamnosidase